MGKVIQFPKQMMNSPSNPRNIEEYNRSIRDFRQSYIDDVSDFMLNIVMAETSRAGFDLDEGDIKDAILIGDAIKSLMMKKNGMPHVLQDFADEYQEFLTDDDENDTIQSDE